MVKKPGLSSGKILPYTMRSVCLFMETKMQGRRRDTRFFNFVFETTVGELQESVKEFRKNSHKSIKGYIAGAILMVIGSLYGKIFSVLKATFEINAGLGIGITLLLVIPVVVLLAYAYKEFIIAEKNRIEKIRKFEADVSVDINKAPGKENIKKVLNDLEPESKHCKKAIKTIEEKLSGLYGVRSESLRVDIQAIEKLSPRDRAETIVEPAEDYLTQLFGYFHTNKEAQNLLTETQVDLLEEFAKRVEVRDGRVIVKPNALPFERVDEVEAYERRVLRLTGKLANNRIDFTQTPIHELMEMAKVALNNIVVSEAVKHGEMHAIMGDESLSQEDISRGKRLLEILSPEFKGNRYKAQCKLFFGKEDEKEPRLSVLIHMFNVATRGLVLNHIPTTEGSMGKLELVNMIRNFTIKGSDISLSEGIYITKQISSAFDAYTPPLESNEPLHQTTSQAILGNNHQKAIDQGYSSSGRSTPQNIYEDDDGDGETLNPL